MRTFYKLLAYTLVGATTNNFVWFALTFFAYLQTHSVISTAFVGGFYLIATAASGFWFGALIDHYKKKYVMVSSSLASLFYERLIPPSVARGYSARLLVQEADEDIMGVSPWRFISTGIIGLIATMFAWRTKTYKLLSKKYLKG